MNQFSAHNLTTTGFTMTEQMEELLVQHCDGTLSASNQIQFETLLRENPAFAEEVRAITSFDAMIDHAHLETQWTNQVDTVFLSEMQQQFAQVVAFGTAAATASVATSAAASVGVSAGTTATTSVVGMSASGISSSGFASLLTGTLIGKSLLVAGVCTAVGYGAWKYTASMPNTSNVPASGQASQETTQGQISREATQNQPSVPNGAQTANTKPDVTLTKKDGNGAGAPTNENVQNQALSQGVEAAPIQANGQDDKSKTNANIESSAALELRNKIEQLSVQLRLKEQGGDKAGAAFDAKKLGMLERTAGKYAESNDFFDKALKAAQTLKLRELEGEIRAELALLYREQGNAEKALASLREAVKILTDEASAKAGRWAKELERWEKR